MRRIGQRATLLASALLWGCATVAPAPDAPIVDALELQGTEQLPQKELKQKIVTSESSWWPSWVPFLGKAEPFDATAWQADLRRITRFYEAHGYYQARILEEQVTPTQAGHVKLLVRLREGQPARLTELQVTGLEELPSDQQEQALLGMPLTKGSIFLEDDWQKAKAQLLSHLRQLGYAEAVVAGQATVDADQASVSATLDAKPGKRFHFGQVLVATDPGAQVPPSLIVDQASSAVHKGAWFSESALSEAQSRVFQMGVFSAVKVNRAAPDTAAGVVPVVIAVKEAPFRSLRMGGGIQGDAIRQDVHLVVEHIHRNIGFARLFDKDARLDRLTLKAKGGVAFVPTILSVAARSPQAQWGPVGSALAEYELPRAFGRRDLSVQASATVSKALEAAYEYVGGEMKVGLLWRPRVDFSLVPSLNFDVYQLSSELTPGTASAPTAAIGCPTRPRLCLIAFADVVAEWDRRDNRLEPREGFYLALDVQVGVSQTLHVTPFARVQPEARGYFSFGENQRFTLAGKVKAGTLLARDNETPIIARFFSGGSGMRGFNIRRLSPMEATAVLDAQKQPIPSGDAFYLGQALPIGGSGLFETSVELRWNAAEVLSVAVFSDGGLVSWQPLFTRGSSFDAFTLAVGLGLRLHTPVGPVRIDVAYRLPGVGLPLSVQQPSTPVVGAQGPRDLYVPANGGCFFNAGYSGNPQYAGSPENLCAWHLSIGEAF